MRQFESLMQYIEAKSDAQTTVGKLANFCNLPQDTLSKRFIRASGVPLQTCLTRLLLRKASQQLLSTDFKIKEISEKLGFTSEYYFCRFFKKHTGMRPGSYRQSIFTVKNE
jgi:AraC-like DNA-binding protein